MSDAWPEPEGGYKWLGKQTAVSPDPPESGQLTLLQMRRFSPASVAIYLRMPEGETKTHVVACALGKGKKRDGTFAPFNGGKDITCVIVTPFKRKQICAVLGINPDHFSKLAARWEKKMIAHRCVKGAGAVLCLWLEPLVEECPGCGRSTVQSGRVDPADMTHRVGQSDPPNVPIWGDASRDEQGDAEEDVFEDESHAGNGAEREKKRQLAALAKWAVEEGK